MHEFQEISPTFLFSALNLIRLAEENYIGTTTWIKVTEVLNLECGCIVDVVGEHIEFQFDHITLIMKIPGETSPVTAPKPRRVNPPRHGKKQTIEVVH